MTIIIIKNECLSGLERDMFWRLFLLKILAEYITSHNQIRMILIFIRKSHEIHIYLQYKILCFWTLFTYLKRTKPCYLNLAQELKCMKVTVIPIIVGALGTVLKNLEKVWEIRRRIKTTALLKLVRTLRKA